MYLFTAFVPHPGQRAAVASIWIDGSAINAERRTPLFRYRFFIDVEVGDLFFCVPIKASVSDHVEIVVQLIIIDGGSSLCALLVMIVILFRLR